jgi:REP element-mobilizing transposase RayT
MDDHVHILVKPFPDYPLQQTIRSWKSYTANYLQRSTGRRGTIWQADYFDRIVRDRKELDEKVAYILNNPRKRWPDNEGEYEWLGCFLEA